MFSSRYFLAGWTSNSTTLYLTANDTFISICLQKKTPIFCAKYWNKIGSDAVENSHMESIIFFLGISTQHTDKICIKTQET